MQTDPNPAFVALDPTQQEADRLLRSLHTLLETTPVKRPPASWVKRIRARFAPPPEPVTGVYLWGGVGRGKTYLMDRFVDEWELDGKHRVHFHHFMRAIHDELSQLPRQPDPLEIVADRLSHDVRVLCLDELVVTDITDAMLLYGLFNALFKRGISLVTTSNIPPDKLYLNGLQRQSFLPAIDLIKRHTQVFELDGGTDYRLRALAREGIYFLTTDAGTEAALERIYDELSGGHDHHASEVEVNGRNIPVRKLGTDVVWFDFDVLCGGPRATSEYIELAQEFHTLVLSGVPVLTQQCEAAARRFLHLVDEFYDRRVKLILSADAPLAELYPTELFDFAFPRLFSRLVEMQSDEYLAAADAASTNR